MRKSFGLFHIVGLILFLVLAGGCSQQQVTSTIVSDTQKSETTQKPDGLQKTHKNQDQNQKSLIEAQNTTPKSEANSTANEGRGADTLPQQVANSNQNQAIAILMYHHVTTRGNWKGNDAVVSVDDFEQHMEYLKKEGYNVVGLRQITDFYKHGIPLPPKPVAITFDDGYESNYRLAYPILKKYNYPFTIFIVVNWIGEQTSGPFRPEQKELLSWPQILEMYESGLCNIQSHTFDSHYQLPGGGYAIAHVKTDPATGKKETNEQLEARVTDDLKQAKEVLEQRLGHKVFALAYPWGVYSPTTLKAVDSLGYEIAFTMTQGANSPKADPRTLLRTGVLQSDGGVEGFKKKLETQRKAVMGR